MKPTTPPTLRAELNRCFAEAWPHLLAASKAAGGSDPASAVPYLRKAAEVLLAAVARVERAGLG